jgi:Protein of unknown function, DUF547
VGRIVSQERQRASSGPGARARVASALAFALATAAPATAAPEFGPMEPIHEHAAWTELLRRYVSGGLVDYASLKRDGQPALDAYLRSLESVERSALESWPRSDQLAFWIDAYNAYTVKLVLDHYPLPTIRSIGLFPGAAFRRKFVPLERAAGRKLSLDDIEHGILRERFRDPRIHFAIVCASRSCPVLRDEAYRGRDLDAQLDDAARAFLRDPARNRYDPGSRMLFLSSIFKWFRGDFEATAGTLAAFVATYVDAPIAAALHRGDVKIGFLQYDWSLNER